MATIRTKPGLIAPDRISDPETRRVVQRLLDYAQWVSDNMPTVPTLPGYRHSVAEHRDLVSLYNDEPPQKIRRFYGTNKWGRLGWNVLPEDVTYPASVTRDNARDIVQLDNDEVQPDYGYTYGVDVDGKWRWIKFPNHSFKFTQTTDTSGDITAGRVYIDGASISITSLPTTVETVTTDTRYWISVDLAAKTATWASGAAWPSGNWTTMIFPVLEILCSADLVIKAYTQHRTSDISIWTLFNFAWKFSPTSSTGGTVTQGTVRIDGAAQTILTPPASWTLTGVTTSTKYWIEIDTSSVTPTVTWKSGAAYAAGSSTLHIFPILEITCAGNVITSWIQRRCSDIVFWQTPVKNSLEYDGGSVQLDGDSAVPGNTKYYGTNGAGTKGFYDMTGVPPSDPSPYEEIEDADAADADTWTYDGTYGLHFTWHTIPAWDTSDHKLYSWCREVVVSVHGQWYSVGAATKKTIAEGVAHSTL